MCSDGISFFSLLRANPKGIHAGGSVAGGLGAAWGPHMGHVAAGLGVSGSTGPAARGRSFWERNVVQCWG